MLGRHSILITLCFAVPGVASLAQETPKPSRDEQTLLDLTNKEREKEKLPPLKIEATLMRLARGHSANMARQEKMEHKLDGKNVTERADDAKYDYRFIAENIAAGENWPLTTVMSEWMGSAPHRKNILADRFTEVGIGVAKSSKGELYYTMVFGRPMAK